MRTRFLYRPGHPRANERGFVDAREVEDLPPDPQHVPVFTDLYMDGQATVDGVDIGSRRKRREYMRATDSLDASDFSRGYYEKERRYRERQDDAKTQAAVIDAYHKVRKV